jgi:hypothetical protein
MTKGATVAGIEKDDKYLLLRLWSRNKKIETHIDWMLSELLSCKETDPLNVNDQTPCNQFVGHALKRIWGLDDFWDNNQILDANHIAAYLATHLPPWQLIGVADDQHTLTTAQQFANESVPVVAVRSAMPGHVALIIPGKLSSSSHWKMKVPNSASFFKGHPNASYVGGRLSNAFSAEKRKEVKVYARIS